MICILLIKFMYKIRLNLILVFICCVFYDFLMRNLICKIVILNFEKCSKIEFDIC